MVKKSCGLTVFSIGIWQGQNCLDPRRLLVSRGAVYDQHNKNALFHESSFSWNYLYLTVAGINTTRSLSQKITRMLVLSVIINVHYQDCVQNSYSSNIAKKKDARFEWKLNRGIGWVLSRLILVRPVGWWNRRMKSFLEIKNKTMFVFNDKRCASYTRDYSRGYSFDGSVNSTNFLVANGLVKYIPSFLLSNCILFSSVFLFHINGLQWFGQSAFAWFFRPFLAEHP